MISWPHRRGVSKWWNYVGYFTVTPRCSSSTEWFSSSPRCAFARTIFIYYCTTFTCLHTGDSTTLLLFAQRVSPLRFVGINTREYYRVHGTVTVRSKGCWVTWAFVRKRASWRYQPEPWGTPIRVKSKGAATRLHPPFWSSWQTSRGEWFNWKDPHREFRYPRTQLRPLRLRLLRKAWPIRAGIWVATVPPSWIVRGTRSPSGKRNYHRLRA